MSTAELFTGDLVEGLEVFGQRIDVWVERNFDEIARRKVKELGAITSADAIRTLMGLPAGVPVPARTVNPLDLLVLTGLASGHVRMEDDDIVRLVVPPMRIMGIVKHAIDWDDVVAVTLLRTHGPRVVVASGALARRALRDADPDLGVANHDFGKTVIQRRPGNRWLKPSWQHWLIAEAAFAASNLD